MALTERNKTVKTARRTVRVTGAFAVNGDIQTVGTIVELSDADARNVIARGLAVDATSAEVTAAGGTIVIAAVTAQEKWNDA